MASPSTRRRSPAAPRTPFTQPSLKRDILLTTLICTGTFALILQMTPRDTPTAPSLEENLPTSTTPITCEWHKTNYRPKLNESPFRQAGAWRAWCPNECDFTSRPSGTPCIIPPAPVADDPFGV